MLTHWWRLAAVPLVLLTAELMVLVVAMPASAALTAGVGALTLPGVVTSHAPQTTTGRSVLTVSPAGPLDNARMVLPGNSAFGPGTFTSTITTTIGSGQ